MPELSLSIRASVLRVIERHPGAVPARQVASEARLGYRQTIDALQALHDAGRITRHGRKFTARWGRLPQPEPSPTADLEAAFRSFFACQ